VQNPKSISSRLDNQTLRKPSKIMDPAIIEQRILQAMPSARVNVQSEDNVHYTARIICQSFAGLSRIERHRQIHDAIGPELGREIHALSLELKSPDEVDG
jgi:acid stress-induced BolA-like protein IbaG/YrbA